MKDNNQNIDAKIKSVREALAEAFKDNPYKSKDQNFGFAEIGNNQAIIQMTIASQQQPHPKEKQDDPNS
jgi:hypothetical protein